MQVTVAGETLSLLPQRAAYWPAARTLLLADAHFGKAAAFRAKGVPVPRGTTQENLAVLTQLVEQTAAQEIIFLGDFLHARESKAPATLASLQAFSASHPSLWLTLVRGNHDDRAGDPPAQLGVQVVDEPLMRGPFALCHLPQDMPGAYVLAGHIHPSVRICTATEGARLPCFWFTERRGVLPAFGGFTGTYSVKPLAKERVYAIAGDTVLQIPAHVLTSAT